MASTKNRSSTRGSTASAPRSTARSSMPRRAHPPAGGLDLGGLTSTLGALTGALGQTVGQTLQATTGLVGGLLDQLEGALAGLKQAADSGSDEAADLYADVLSLLERSAAEGKQGASQLLGRLEGSSGRGRS